MSMLFLMDHWSLNVILSKLFNGPFAHIRVISTYAPYALGRGQGKVRIVLRIGKSPQRHALGLIIVCLDMLHMCEISQSQRTKNRLPAYVRGKSIRPL